MLVFVVFPLPTWAYEPMETFAYANDAPLDTLQICGHLAGPGAALHLRAGEDQRAGAAARPRRIFAGPAQVGHALHQPGNRRAAVPIRCQRRYHHTGLLRDGLPAEEDHHAGALRLRRDGQGVPHAVRRNAADRRPNARLSGNGVDVAPP